MRLYHVCLTADQKTVEFYFEHEPEEKHIIGALRAKYSPGQELDSYLHVLRQRASLDIEVLGTIDNTADDYNTQRLMLLTRHRGWLVAQLRDTDADIYTEMRRIRQRAAQRLISTLSQSDSVGQVIPVDSTCVPQCR
jgi:hypothetical protein